jgi:hypothetical protein
MKKPGTAAWKFFELVRVKELESENSRLQRRYAELALEKEAIKGC